MQIGMRKESRLAWLFRRLGESWQFYLLVLPALIYVIIFCYIPMYGVQIAFRDFRFKLGIVNSPWVGLKYFYQFFSTTTFWQLLRNTVSLSVFSLVAGFPIPIILAIMLNEVRGQKFKKSVQMITYAPHFISTVVMCSMIILFLNEDNGLINHLVALFGGNRIPFLAKQEYFQPIYVISNIWQEAGWGTIIYIAALSGVDPSVVESAVIDGAGRFRKIWHIDLPSIRPTIVILLILNAGGIMNVGFEKVLLLQNALNMQTADVISTYVYRVGLTGGQYSYTAAIGLFNSIVNVLLLVAVNAIANKVSEVSLW